MKRSFRFLGTFIFIINFVVLDIEVRFPSSLSGLSGCKDVYPPVIRLQKKWGGNERLSLCMLMKG